VARRAASSGPLAYVPGIDGLRALSVVAVLLYHGGVAWIGGGFLGVEIFFVISGYLITSLLLAEWRREGSLGLRGFWFRRARRLLPALYVLLAATVAFCAVFLRSELADLRGDVVAALGYVTNWYLIAQHQSYFEALGRPSLLKHLWSLAVEEQFYLVWPVVFALAMPLLGGRPKVLARWLVAGAIASTLWMAVLYEPFTDPSRVYYGTDTRASGLLLGAALACVWAPWRLTRRTGPGAPFLLDAAGVGSLVALGLLLARTDEFGAFLYRGGFFVVGVLTCVAIAVVVHPAARLGRVLGVAPLVWVGVRSYALYLWHWPVYMVTRPRLDVPLTGLPLLALRLAITFVLAELSYRYVEVPIRQGALGRLAARLAASHGEVRARLVGRTALAAGAGLSAMALLAWQLGGAHATPPSQIAVDRGPPASSEPSLVSAIASLEPAPGPLPRHLVVVGDSVGMTLVLNAPDALASSFVLTDGSVEGCGVLEAKIESTRGFGRDLGRECAGWEQEWLAAATESSADLALVTVGAWEVFDATVDGEHLAFGSPEWDAYFDAQLAKGVAELRGAGLPVALLEVPCFRPVDGGGLIALPERGDDARTRHLNERLRAAAAADPQHVVTIPSPAGYCDDPALGADLGHRWDGVHYYRPGAALVWETIAPALLAIPIAS
jgi:peptidoglycan/LPS O-acetylase OafA/YrhL